MLLFRAKGIGDPSPYILYFFDRGVNVTWEKGLLNVTIQVGTK